MNGVIGAAIGASLALGVPHPAPVDVQWNKGSGPVRMGKGLPNPPGWYRAAVGAGTPAKILYLTFDDGPSRFTPALLKTLRRHDAVATFFITGRAAAQRPGLVGRARRAGNAIGNHTYGHPRLVDLPTRAVRTQLRRTAKVVPGRVGPCMRPPYGLINARVARASIAAGYQPVLWTSHIEDWESHDVRWTVHRLQRLTKPGAVILMHDTHARTVSAVRKMLPRWRAAGYRYAVVPVCEPE